jgi:ribosomal protein L37AE/L43A
VPKREDEYWAGMKEPKGRGLCPFCGSFNISYNKRFHSWRCNNCEHSFPVPSYGPGREFGKTTKRSPISKKTTSHNTAKRISKHRIPKWLIALIFTLALSISGWGISVLIGSFIPLWMLLGFSIIFSIEKWFGYVTRKYYKGIGNLYRLGLNLAILSLLGLIIWSSIQLFTQQFVKNALLGSLIVLAEFVFFIWLWKVVAKNSWRWPSMKLTVFSLICLFLAFSFAGVQPMASYKDQAISFVSSVFSNSSGTAVEESSSTPASTDIDEVTSPDITTPPEVTQPTLADPTWNQLLEFLLSDDTDSHPYSYPTFVCHDFAEMLQSQANDAGWRCAIITVQLSGYPDFFNYGIPSNAGHNFNAFNTTDRGLVYIDCTRSPGIGPANQDHIVDIQIGEEYIPMALFPSPGWSTASLSMGIVVSISEPQW